MGRTVELRIAGQSYRVVSSAPESELQRLAALVSDKLAELAPAGRQPPPQGLLLVAMALAHDVEEERGRRRSVESRTQELLRRLLSHIDGIVSPEEASSMPEFEPPQLSK
jgi:cell division protein ZapA